MASYDDDVHDELFPVGIAKDGYIIWGPYNNQGSEWSSCDVDICNGLYVDDTNYGYVSTSFHPYFLGCWGPGNNATVSVECSTNGRYCASSSSGGSFSFFGVQMSASLLGILGLLYLL
mmetsp:Transcript_40523/g.39044  ORF Transcript_40523/g.39044 Transcript_40523/m.39044 type:complete len:118 (-) Transcript_40523:40-393(-)